MRKPRAFRPSADPLETRMVPSSVTVAMRAAHLANFRPALQLHSPFALRFSGGVPSPGSGFLSATRTATGTAGTNLLGSGGLFGGRFSPLPNPLSTTIRTSTGVTNLNNPATGFGAGLTFPNAVPGAISGLTFRNAVPGAISGLTFTNSLARLSQTSTTFINTTSAFTNGFSFNPATGMFGF